MKELNMVIASISSKHFAWLEGLGPKFRPSLVYYLIAINQKPPIMSLSFFTLLKVWSETIKNNKYRLLKLTDHILLSFYQNHQKSWNRVPIFTIMIKISSECLS